MDTNKLSIPAHILAVINSLEFILGLIALYFQNTILCGLMFLLLSFNLLIYLLISSPDQAADVEEYLDDDRMSADENGNNSENTNGSTNHSAALQQQVMKLTEENQKLLREKQLAASKDLLEPASDFYSCPLRASEAIDLCVFFRDYFHEQDHAFRKKEIDLTLNLPKEGDTCEIFLSKTALSLICQNLLDNALKFTPSGGSFYFTLTPLGDEIVMIWKNTGNSVSPGELPNLFHLNFQGHNHKNGTGLGLTQVQAIVKDYGGEISCRSTQNSGFAVHITLPRSKKEASHEK